MEIPSHGKSVNQICYCYIDSHTRTILNDNPDVLISTPSRLLQLLQSSSLSLENLRFLAFDEADLLLSYGHKDDLTRIVDPSNNWVPRLGVQRCLMSATLGEDVQGVKGLILRNPVCAESINFHLGYTVSNNTSIIGYPHAFGA